MTATNNADLAYLSISATIIENGMAGIAALLAGGSICYFATSRRGALKDALQQVTVQIDRLDALRAAMVEALGGENKK